MKETIEIPLSPYPFSVFVAPTRQEYETKHLQLFGEEDKLTSAQGGRFSYGKAKGGKGVYLIWGKNRTSITHELSHVVLDLFEMVGIDPRGCGGEPFCYMLCHLIDECKSTKS